MTNEKQTNLVYREAVAQNLERVMDLIVLPQQQFVGDPIPYEPEYEDLSDDLYINIKYWANKVLEFDDVTNKLNKVIAGIIGREGYMFDYMVFEELCEKFDLDKEMQGYTYNDPDFCRLDHDIHFTEFRFEGSRYVIFNVHYGADARAGFSLPVCFKINDWVDYIVTTMEVRVWDEEDNDYTPWDIVYSDGDFRLEETGEVVHVSPGCDF